MSSHDRLDQVSSLPRHRERRPVDIHVGARVRERRRLLGLGRAELAQVLGLSVQQIQKYESGDSTVSASRLYELGVKLGVSPGYFFDDMPSLDGEENSSEASASVPSSSEVRQMVAIYRNIGNQALRHHLYELARAMAKVDAKPGGKRAPCSSRTPRRNGESALGAIP